MVILSEHGNASNLTSLITENNFLKEQVKKLEEQLRQAGIRPLTESGAANIKFPALKPKTEQIPSPKKYDLRTYDKRAGTTDHGKKYEYLICAFYALKFCNSDRISDFEMTTNNKIYGDFDDVSLKVTYTNQKSQTFLIQLKHSENRKNITSDMLSVAANSKKATEKTYKKTTEETSEKTTEETSEKTIEETSEKATEKTSEKTTEKSSKKTDFSLLKYLKSFNELENKNNISCILFTNRRCLLKNNQEMTIEDRKVVVEVCSTTQEPEGLLNTNDNSKSCIFKFKTSPSGETTNLGRFFQQFYLFSDQSNVTKVEMKIDQVLQTLLHCKITEDFVNFMQMWWESKFILTKSDVIAKLAEIAFSPFVQELYLDNYCQNSEKSKLMQDAIMQFDMTIVKDYDNNITKGIWTEIPADKDDIFKAALKYKVAQKTVKILDDLSIKELSKVLWFLNEVPLIVKYDEANNKRIDGGIKLLQEERVKKKIVLLGTKSAENYPQWKIFDNLSKLEHEDFYLEIIQNFQVSLQGRHPISIEELMGEDPKISTIIEVKELLQMTQEVLRVGNQIDTLPEIYIPRTVSTTFLVTRNLLNSYNHKEVFLIFQCADKHLNVLQLKNIDVLDMKTYLSDQPINQKHEKLVLSTNKCSKSDFDKIRRMTGKLNVFLLQIIDEVCSILMQSWGDIAKLKRYNINRCPIEESKIHSVFQNPINAIVAQPGMGKSTLVTYLSQNCPPTHWSVRVNLIDHNAFLKTRPSNEKISEYLLGGGGEDPESFLHKLKQTLLEKNRLDLFLDGLDEIESSSFDLVLNYVIHASSRVYVWISSRDNLKNTITNRLNVFPIDIQELHEEQQKKYIKSRLIGNFEEDQIQKIINTIFTNADVSNSQQLLGIPLQLYIITENFLKNEDLFQKLNEDIFLLTKMYEIFFNGKKKHQYKKLKVDEYEYQLDDDFDNRLEQYELPALQSVLDANIFTKLKLNLCKTEKFLTKLRSNNDKFGIIQQITDENYAIFAHQTYAEYFACIWFKSNLDKLEIVKNDFFSVKYQNLRLIFDIMLAEKNPLHLATIYKNPEQFKKHIGNLQVKDIGGRTPLHLLCSHGLKYPDLRPRDAYGSVNLAFFEYQPQSESSSYKNIFEYLLVCDPFENDGLFQWDCINYSIQAQCIYPIEYYLGKYGSSINLDTLFKKFDVYYLARYCAYLGYSNLVTALLKHDLNIMKDPNDGTIENNILHKTIEGRNDNFEQYCTSSEHIKIVETLIDHGCDINNKDFGEKTPLHLAAEYGDYDVVNLLLEKGADANATDAIKYTPLMYALSQKKNVDREAIKLLAERTTNVNQVDKDGRKTALILASENGYPVVVKMLLEKGATGAQEDTAK